MLKETGPQQKKSGAQMHPDFRNKSQAYLDTHAHALFSSLGRLLHKPATFMLTLAVLAISMALTSSFYLLVKNFQQLTGNVEASNRISIYLKSTVSMAVAEQIKQAIAEDPLVESVQLITPDQALAEFKANSNLGTAVDALKENPLPPVLVVLPKNSLEDEQNLQVLVSQFQKMPEVEIAESELQWAKRLRAIVGVAKRVVLLFGVLFGSAVLLIISNTVRLELQNRQEEVFISQLVGATHAFIRRPFLYTGFWLGFLSGVAAWFMVAFLMLFLRQPVRELSEQYTGQYNLVFLDYAETFMMLGFASLLGVLGAWWVLGNQLRASQPE